MSVFVSRLSVSALCPSIAAVFALLMAPPALSAACKQANAVYQDRDAAYELRFTPLGSQAAAASNRFSVKIKSSSVEMQGFVLLSEDPERSNAILMFNCPEGDTTGEELEACTVWQGPVYGIDPKGEIANLNTEGGEAAEKLMLPGLGPAMRESALWEAGKANVAPWDVLTYGGCIQ